jgi:hypothetical protein
MFFKIESKINGPTPIVSLECPHCGHFGTFQNIGADNGLKTNGKTHSFGQRQCPRPQCNGHIFTICFGHDLIACYPPKLISYDSTNIPKPILESFQEAIICFSSDCIKASAIMIRKTLEEICNDKNANGNNLFKRLENLSEKIVLPIELREAMQELRLLGNDAAHIEAKTYDEIGKDEIEISIEFTKEILKGIYQYDVLLDRLRSLKRKDAI